MAPTFPDTPASPARPATVALTTATAVALSLLGAQADSTGAAGTDLPPPARDNHATPPKDSAAHVGLENARALEITGKPAAALRAYRRVVSRYRDSPAAAEAQFSIARLYAANREFRPAFDAYQSLLDHFRGSPRFSDALAGQLEIARQVLGQHQKNRRLGRSQPRRELPEIDTLVRMLETVIGSGRFSPQAPEAKFLLAVTHDFRGDHDAAIAAHEDLVADHPEHPLADDAAFQIGYIHLKANRRPVKDPGRWDDARDAFELMVAQFPDSNKTPVARRQLEAIHRLKTAELVRTAEFYEKTGNTKAAAVYYRLLREHDPAAAPTTGRGDAPRPIPDGHTPDDAATPLH